MFTAGRYRTRSFELSYSHDVAAEIEQQVERRAAARPVDARLNGCPRRDTHSSDTAAAAARRQPGHGTHQRLADGDRVRLREQSFETGPILLVAERECIAAHRLIDVDAQGRIVMLGGLG